MIPKILDSDPPIIIAQQIYDHFKLDMSCTIYGWQDGVPKGMKVVEELIRIDQYENTQVAKDGRRRRKRYMEPNTVGGYVAQKIFKYKEEMREGKTVIVIWRKQ